MNEDPSIYYDVSNTADVARARRVDKRRVSAFDLQGYQVVRSQFTQVRYEGPSMTITEGKISFNLFCMRKFAEVPFIQLLLHPAERKIAIRPCKEHDPHSIRWRRDSNKPLFPKSLTCSHFGTALYGIMKWDPEYVYRVRGIWAKQRDEQIMVFNLANAMPMVTPSDMEEGQRRRRIALCPAGWEDDFGEEFYEHVLENGFYYLAPDYEWKTNAESIPAPGIDQYQAPTAEALQLSIESLMRGTETNDH